MDAPILIVLIFVLGFALLMAFALAALLVRPWLRAVMHGAPVMVTHIIGMRLRGNPPMLLIDAFIALTRAGVSTTIGEVEGVYVDHRVRIRHHDDLVQLVRELQETKRADSA